VNYCYQRGHFKEWGGDKRLVLYLDFKKKTYLSFEHYIKQDFMSKQKLVKQFKTKPLLFIMDNCDDLFLMSKEQLILFIKEILEETTQIKFVLITRRAPELGLSEQVFEIAEFSQAKAKKLFEHCLSCHNISPDHMFGITSLLQMTKKTPLNIFQIVQRVQAGDTITMILETINEEKPYYDISQSYI